jgi:hypothetical protein
MDSEKECKDDNDLPSQIVLEIGLLGSYSFICTLYASFVQCCFVEFYYIRILVCLFIFVVLYMEIKP